MRLRARGCSGLPTRLSLAAASSSALGRTCRRRHRLPCRLHRRQRHQDLLDRRLRRPKRLRSAPIRASEIHTMPRTAGATTAARAPSTRTASTAPTARTAARDNRGRRRCRRRRQHPRPRRSRAASSLVWTHAFTTVPATATCMRRTASARTVGRAPRLPISVSVLTARTAARAARTGLLFRLGHPRPRRRPLHPRRRRRQCSRS